MEDFGERNPTFPPWEALGIDEKDRRLLEHADRAEFSTPVLEQTSFQNGLRRVDIKGKIGVEKEDGGFALKPNYDWVDFPQSSPSKWIACALANKEAGFGFVSREGDEMPQKYVRVSPFKEGLAAVQTQDGWGFIDETGKLVIPCRFQLAKDFSDGLAAVNLNKKWGYVDKKGTLVVEPVFDSAGNFQHGLARVRSRSYYWGVLRKEKLTKSPA